MINNNHHILHNTIIDASAHKWNSNDIINSAPPVHVHLPAIGLEIRRTSPFSQHFNGGRVSSTPLSHGLKSCILIVTRSTPASVSRTIIIITILHHQPHKVVLDGWMDGCVCSHFTHSARFIYNNCYGSLTILQFIVTTYNNSTREHTRLLPITL